jgi:hypothetical protein
MATPCPFDIKIGGISAVDMVHDLGKIAGLRIQQQVIMLCEAPHYVKLILHPLEIITIFKSSTRYHST